MILRAKVSKRIDNYHYTVCIPQFNKARGAVGATPESELYTATISVDVGISPLLKPNDTVLVAFENGSEEAPVIIGILFNAAAKKCQSSASFDSLNVDADATFSSDVTIGEVTSDNLKCLEGLEVNVQTKFGKVDESIKANKEAINLNKVAITAVSNRTGVLETKVKTQGESIQKNRTDIDANKSTMDNHISDTDEHVSESDRASWNGKAESNHTHKREDISGLGVVILEKTKSYGSTLPSSGVEGQLFFKTK